MAKAEPRVVQVASAEAVGAIALTVESAEIATAVATSVVAVVIEDN